MLPGPKGAAPALGGAELLEALGGAIGDLAVTATDVAAVPSAHLASRTVWRLGDQLARATAEQGLAGVVVTSGTDTLEEVAFLLDLLWRRPEPVVVTGGMRHPGLPGADGPANLRAAVVVAADPGARGLGVMVVLDDEVHAARCVTKTSTHRPSAFRSVPGSLGWVVEDRLRLVLRPAGRPRVPPPQVDAAPRVALLTHALGDDGSAVRAVLASGVDGLVYEASGGGHVGPTVADALASAAAQVPVALASRTGGGPVLERTYDYIGSEQDLVRRGLLGAAWLPGRKARLLLEVLLAAGIQGERLRALLADPFGDEEPVPAP
jgi:L-asparaginase